MAITPIAGTGGGFTAPGFAVGTAIKFLSFRGALEGREFNTTGFGDGGWVTGAVITGRVTGEALGILDSVTPPVPAAVMNATFGVATMAVTSMVLTFATGKNWTFNALITSVEIERAEEGAASSVYRIRFVSNGPVAQTW